MKILFFSDNFPPESNAPAIRTFEHVALWVKDGHEVTVITCVPNFPVGRVFDGYSNSFYQRETIDGISVIRVWSYISRNEGVFKRTLDYLSFMISSTIAGLFLPRHDVVIGTSPQFFSAVAAWLVAKVKRTFFVFELRDFWPESIVAVGAMKESWALRKLEIFSNYLYRQADLIIPVTNAFSNVLKKRGIDPKKIVVVTNGIEPGSYKPITLPKEIKSRWGIPTDAFASGYIGTLGMAHGAKTVLESAELLRNDKRFHFILMGPGAERAEIISYAVESGLTNVSIIDAQPRQEALDVLNALDVSLVLLKNSPLFETVIPSKIFEAMELGKPIILGIRGESKDIVVDQAKAGIAIKPEDSEDLVEKLLELYKETDLCRSMGKNGQSSVQNQFRRSTLARKMLAAIETRISN
ncbi:MAG: glycosyltransferase family 4 protein [Pseudomonadota bacterium]|nr:glycosyltransferase family 4 protein [Pseudomonadota bacterium]